MFPTKHNNFLALVMATFILRVSFKNPTFPLLFDQTVLNIMISFSLPWYPSTVDISGIESVFYNYNY